MNGEFVRGEIYWWRMGDSVGSEEGARRPAVIVSSDVGNAKSNVVNIAYLTSQHKYGVINVEVACGERRSWVMCNQIATVDKSRALSYINSLDDDEMAAVDRAIMVALGLHNEEKEDESCDDEIETLKEELTSANHAGNVWKKLYEKAVEDLVILKYKADMDYLREKKMVKPAEKPVEKPVVEEKPSEKVDINTCSKSDLRSLGCDEILTKNIIARRPYKTVEELKVVPGMKSVAYALLKARVCVTEVPREAPKVETAGKININTASAKEISEFLGISLNYAWAITGYRQREGMYRSVSDLSKITRLAKNFLERYGDKLTV